MKKSGLLAISLALATAACSPSAGDGSNPLGGSPTSPSQADSSLQGNVDVTRTRVYIKDGRLQAYIEGPLGDGCTVLQPVRQQRTANTIVLTVSSARHGDVCIQVLKLMNEWVPLDGPFPPGEYELHANRTSLPFRIVRGADSQLRLDPDPGPPPQYPQTDVPGVPFPDPPPVDPGGPGDPNLPPGQSPGSPPPGSGRP